MTPDSSAPIFIHSLWRAGSTYLFQVFRRSEAGYYCYQEPLHEIALFNKDNPENLIEYVGKIMQPLRHPPLSTSYFQELHDIFPSWQPYIQKIDIYDAYFSSECSEKLRLFFNSLIQHAQGRAVIQECRTSNRIGAFKKFFGGTHIYLWRNPWDQWWSYKVTDYFEMIQLLLINAADAPPVIKALRQKLHFKEYHNESLSDEMAFFNAYSLSAEDSYCCFYTLWCLAFLEARQYADFLLNIDQLGASHDYQTEYLDALGEIGIIGLDFSDCRIHCTQFTFEDAAFFRPIEDVVYELLSHDVTLEQIDAIKQARLQSIPSSQHIMPNSTVDNTVLEDAKRAREIVIRSETLYHNRLKQQLLLQEQLKQQHQVEINHLLNKAEQQCLGLQQLLVEGKNNFAQHQIDQKQLFANLLRQIQEKKHSADQLYLKEFARLNSRLHEALQRGKREKDQLRAVYTQKLADVERMLEAGEKYIPAENSELIKQFIGRESVFTDHIHDCQVKLDRERLEHSEHLEVLRQEFAQREHNYFDEHLSLYSLMLERSELLLRGQIETLVRNTEREREFGEQLQALHQLAEQEKKELSAGYAKKLAIAEQERAALEKTLLQEQLAMQARSSERECEFGKQLMELHQLAEQEKQELRLELTEYLVREHEFCEQEREKSKQEYLQKLETLRESFRQAETGQLLRFQHILEQVIAEVVDIRNSRWLRLGLFLGWLPFSRFKRLSDLLTTGLNTAVSVNIIGNDVPVSAIEHPLSCMDAIIEGGPLKEMDAIDQLLLSSEAEFITKAYQLILGRQADPTGIAHYRRWLRIGKSRVEILADLMASQEAQLANRPGLDELHVLIRHTGAGLKGWRKWFALPRIMSHRMSVFEGQISNIVLKINNFTATVKVIDDDLLVIKGTLARIENRFNKQIQAIPLESFQDSFPVAVSDSDEPAAGRIDFIGSDVILVANENQNIAVKVENQSNMIWETSANCPVFMSYHWYYLNGKEYKYENPRTVLSKPVAPGESQILTVNVQSPDAPGDYLLEITMVMEGYFWFENRGLRVSCVPVNVHLSKLTPHAKRIHDDLLSVLLKRKMEDA